jgi:homopolymeric O-antigen transport system permease protein
MRPRHHRKTALEMSAASLTLRFLQRELRNRFAGSFSGGLWALMQPLMMLAVYSFVFVKIFPARVPGGDTQGYVPFLVAALWPWNAFSEAVMRSTTVVQENAPLIGKVVLPREILVVASVAATFALQLAGFIAILVVLRLLGKGVAITMLPFAVLLYVPLFALALGFALLFSSVQVFVRDLAQALGQIMVLLMFAAPVFYDRAQLPPQWQHWLDFHPFTFYAEAFRAILLGHGSVSLAGLAIALVVAAIVLLAGHAVFRRLDPYFEDFL